MKRALFAAMLLAATSLSSGCCWNGRCGHGDPCHSGLFKNCGLLHSKRCPKCGQSCGWFHKCGGWFKKHHGAAADGAMGPYGGGPPAAQITYPYYTNRGPRDFLAPEPRGIGP